MSKWIRLYSNEDYTSGLFADLPATGTALGARYYATDAATWYSWNGSSWDQEGGGAPGGGGSLYMVSTHVKGIFGPNWFTYTGSAIGSGGSGGINEISLNDEPATTSDFATALAGIGPNFAAVSNPVAGAASATISRCTVSVWKATGSVPDPSSLAVRVIRVGIDGTKYDVSGSNTTMSVTSVRSAYDVTISQNQVLDFGDQWGFMAGQSTDTGGTGVFFTVTYEMTIN